jgi:hypothetical protein
VSICTRIVNGFRALRKGDYLEQELDEELRAYLETSIDQKMRAGMAPSIALRAE